MAKKYISKINKSGNNLYIKDTEAQQNISSHVGNTSNPHSVTKSQVGLSNVTNDSQVKRSEMGAASGVATLDSAGKVPTSQLPSYVDDVLEYDTKSKFPATGEAGKIYVDKSTNTSWRWSGTTYVQIKGDLVIGTTTGTAADGGAANTHYNNKSNPHSVTKAQVGLGSVVNTGDSATPVSGGTTKFTTGGAYTELAKKVDKVDGKGLSTNDYTTDEKNKLSGIAAGAEVNVQSDWNATSGDAFIKNKPTIPDSFQWFGTSSTAADTVQKEVSIPSITSLKTGQIIVVRPTVTSSGVDSTLKLNSFDAYPMIYNNAAITTGTDSIVWSANIPSLFVFDGSHWVFLGHGLDSNTTYSTMSVAEGTTGTSTKARTMRADYLKQIIQAWAPQSDWNATSGNAVILNKPTIPSEVTESTVSGWGFTKNTGTITDIKMNGSSKGTSGVVDLGTVITAHQDISGKQDKVAKLGSSTKPLYTSAAGTFTECSTYAGGTAVTLNGTSKAASTASLYAPISAGMAGQILISSAGEPNWKTGEILHYITNPSGIAGSTTSGARNRAQWTGTLDGVATLYTGLTILYKVAVAGVSAGVTLNLNSSGEHPVVRNANTGVSTNYPVGAIIPLTYDADQEASVYVSETSTEYTGCWKVADYDANTTYSPLSLGFCYGTCSTAAGTAAKTVTMKNYTLVSHGIVAINFSNAITVVSATLNINSKGAKAIYYKGSALAANVIQAGDIVTMQYNGSQYHIISIIRNSGLPKTDLSSEVQESLTKADETQFSTAYIGAGASASAVAVAANLKSNLRRGAKTSVTASSNKLWILVPSTYNEPNILMSGTEVPVDAQSNTTVNNITYKVWSSKNIYTGTFNIVLL